LNAGKPADCQRCYGGCNSQIASTDSGELRVPVVNERRVRKRRQLQGRYWGNRRLADVEPYFEERRFTLRKQACASRKCCAEQ
jgi:hypothetical protein